MGRWVRGTAAIVMAVSLQSGIGAAEDDPIVIVVNKRNPISAIGLRDLARLYSGEVTEWTGGESVVVINRPFESDVRAKFYRVVLHAKPTQKFFHPGSPIPFETVRVESESAVPRFVARLPWAIAYCYLSVVDGSVKVLKVDGRLPTDAEYGLK